MILLQKQRVRKKQGILRLLKQKKQHLNPLRKKKQEQEKIELTNDEKKAIREAESNGQHIYVMTVHIQKDCLLKAARAFLVFKAVEDFGQILVYRPSYTGYSKDEKFEF